MNGPIAETSLAHADLMDRTYRYQKYIYDLTRKYYLLGRDRTIAGLNLAPGRSLLEIGCGTGRNLAMAARRHPGAVFYGLDISAEMLALARARLGENLLRPEDLKLLDAASFRPEDFDTDGFDRILISYALSMIPDWRGTIERAVDALAPDGELHIVDFGEQDRLPAWFRRALRSWLARFHVTPRAELPAMLEAISAKRNLTLHSTTLVRDYARLFILKRSSAQVGG
ncbi:class I SAM-dependent methyltransferase [Rhizobium alvei]|uniref:Class I SAM-dependent methyltransferase n=1 Tax=Rhizobium alvei TaxID=1132659 RepID=A0ABT8YIM3_9HYPH|nr:class I SAM-dependent methyltransferase [Rhizobium alvei]MDO6963538.1 class I SAM-dependent methyltransferase [Rhizobium alvei]